VDNRSARITWGGIPKGQEQTCILSALRSVKPTHVLVLPPNHGATELHPKVLGWSVSSNWKVNRYKYIVQYASRPAGAKLTGIIGEHTPTHYKDLPGRWRRSFSSIVVASCPQNPLFRSLFIAIVFVVGDDSLWSSSSDLNSANIASHLHCYLALSLRMPTYPDI